MLICEPLPSGQWIGDHLMNSQQQAHFEQQYQSHFNHLILQGKRPAAIDAYTRAVRRISDHCGCSSNNFAGTA